MAKCRECGAKFMFNMKKKKQKEWMKFSQNLLIASFFVFFFFTGPSIILCLTGKPPLAEYLNEF